MSGICGIVRDSHEAAVDDAALDAMVRRMAFRGPDGGGRWRLGRTGLGHALLRTMDSHAAQPFTLDGATHVVADARLDGRDEMVAALRAAGRACSLDASEPELLLHAYGAWGGDCVTRLLGDFSFAIWDAREQALFCARDHFGVKPFFHAHTAGSFAFSNTLEALLGLPGVGRELDELAIADFLLFDALQDPASTAFAAIRRLPPAHCMTVRDGVASVRRYWSLPRDHGVRYREVNDYVERFTHLLDQAVADRLRTGRVSVAMSGGLDSPALAASALRVGRRGGRALEVHAHTVVYDSLIPDQERHFSTLAARQLGIAIHHRAADGYALYATPESAQRFAEPSHEPDGAAGRQLLRDQAGFARVALMGWDGDALLRESPRPYLRSLWRARRFGRLAVGAAWYALHEKRVLPRSLLGRRPAAGANVDPFPSWLNPDFEQRLALRERWHAVLDAPSPSHPLRPYAHRMLSMLDRSSNFFDRFDPGVSRVQLEVRHPFLDLRLVDFCLGLPPVPWCVHKRILRESLRGVIPEEVRRRPKTPLGLPGHALLARDDARWVDDFVATDGLERYIERKRIARAWGTQDPQAAWLALRPLTLDFWLRLQSSQPTQEMHA